MNCFGWNGFYFQNKLPDPQSANEKAIGCDNLILPSRLALLGPTPGKGSSAAYKLPVSVLTPAGNSSPMPLVMERREDSAWIAGDTTGECVSA